MCNNFIIKIMQKNFDEWNNLKKNFVILSQIRLFDSKRLKYCAGKIKKENFEKLKKQLFEIIS
jgi:hypothetical protein